MSSDDDIADVPELACDRWMAVTMNIGPLVLTNIGPPSGI
jgi:hypothetical protein